MKYYIAFAITFFAVSIELSGQCAACPEGSIATTGGTDIND